MGCVSYLSQCVESSNFCLPWIWLAVISLRLSFPVRPREKEQWEKQIQETHHWTLTNCSTFARSHHPMITLWTWPALWDGFDRWKHFCFSCQHLQARFFPEFPFSHSRFYSTSVNTVLAATAAQLETQWTLALHAMSFETSLARQTKLFFPSCVGLPQSFREWSLMYYLQSLITFDLSLPLSLSYCLALLFFNFLRADMHWYHLLPFIKYFVLAKCSP